MTIPGYEEASSALLLGQGRFQLYAQVRQVTKVHNDANSFSFTFASRSSRTGRSSSIGAILRAMSFMLL